MRKTGVHERLGKLRGRSGVHCLRPWREFLPLIWLHMQRGVRFGAMNAYSLRV
jgi:hypothetical protein